MVFPAAGRRESFFFAPVSGTGALSDGPDPPLLVDVAAPEFEDVGVEVVVPPTGGTALLTGWAFSLGLPPTAGKPAFMIRLTLPNDGEV